MGLTETISNGRRFRWHSAEALSKFYVGVDLGQSMDPTALCVLHHCRTPLDRGTTIGDEPGLFEQRQDVAETFRRSPPRTVAVGHGLHVGRGACRLGTSATAPVRRR